MKEEIRLDRGSFQAYLTGQQFLQLTLDTGTEPSFGNQCNHLQAKKSAYILYVVVLFFFLLTSKGCARQFIFSNYSFGSHHGQDQSFPRPL